MEYFGLLNSENNLSGNFTGRSYRSKNIKYVSGKQKRAISAEIFNKSELDRLPRNIYSDSGSRESSSGEDIDDTRRTFVNDTDMSMKDNEVDDQVNECRPKKHKRD